MGMFPVGRAADTFTGSPLVCHPLEKCPPPSTRVTSRSCHTPAACFNCARRVATCVRRAWLRHRFQIKRGQQLSVCLSLADASTPHGWLCAVLRCGVGGSASGLGLHSECMCCILPCARCCLLGTDPQRNVLVHYLHAAMPTDNTLRRFVGSCCWVLGRTAGTHVHLSGHAECISLPAHVSRSLLLLTHRSSAPVYTRAPPSLLMMTHHTFSAQPVPCWRCPLPLTLFDTCL